MSIEAMKRALEALETEQTLRRGYMYSGGKRIVSTADDAIEALRTALSQQPDNTSCKSVQKRLEAQQPAASEPVAWSEREQLRHAQAAVVMPMIGPLLDAWENSDREVMSQEPELSKQLRNINSAMEDADTHPAPSVPKDHQIAALVNKVRDIAHQFHGHGSLRERIANVLVPALKAGAKTDKPAAVRNPFAARCYTMSESHLSGHRLIVGFEKLGDAQDAHEWVARQARGDFTHPAPSVPDAAIDSAIYDQCPDFDDWHEGPSIDDIRAIVRAAMLAAK